MRIREYTNDDRSDCLEIFQSNIPRFFLPEELEGFSDFLDRFAVGTYWVLEVSDQITACGGIGIRDTEGRLHYGMVSRQFHRQGIGSQLIKFRMSELVENINVKAISLDTSQYNPEFFNRFGFVETCMAENAYGPGLHRHDMRMVLPDSTSAREVLLKKLLAR